MDSQAQLWKEHPILISTLMTAAFIPAVALVAAAGIFLEQTLPKPHPIIAIAGLFLFVALFICGMLVGAFVWIHIAKYFCDRETARRMFCGPGLPVFTTLSAWIYRSAYDSES
jgi:hypothetical protein